jgi:hypothetical protein
MAYFTVRKVKVLGVGLLKPLHEFGQRGSRTLEEQVHMVGHEAVGVQRDFVFPAVAGKPLKVGFEIPAGAEGFLTLVASNDNVVEETGGKQARTACHRPNL